MKTIIVAFDGLDYDLIKKYDCTNVMQKKFGKIDNHTGIYRIVTPELFASFITGKTWKGHGIKGFKAFKNPILSKLAAWARGFPSLFNFLEKKLKLNKLLDWKNPTKEDLKCDSFFSKIANSKAIKVPAYSEDSEGVWKDALREEGIKTSKREIQKAYEKRKSLLFKSLKKDYELIFVHFRKPDGYQHLFGDVVKRKNEIKRLYREIDKLAKKIKKKGKENGYEWFLFMSDHGLPKEREHNKNSFYSSNLELGLNNPRITDFHDLVIKNISRTKR